MVWKHSYNQVDKSQLSRMHTYSQEFMPCVNLSVSWCNVPDKQPTGYGEQMVAAYHHDILVFAYKARLNPTLGKDRNGPFLENTHMIVDRCELTRGFKPNPYFERGGYDLLFGKYMPGLQYLARCNTMSRAYEYDCRWESCLLPKSISESQQQTQMTMVIYVR